jgi:hypothetical protein
MCRRNFPLAICFPPGQVILAMNDSSPRPTEAPDPAAIFAAATSLRNACDVSAKKQTTTDLSAAYHGYDQFMREVMRIATLFETWACAHVAFSEFSECWPYFLEDRFGRACLQLHSADSIHAFDDADCLRLAMLLRLPVFVDDSIIVSLDVRAENPIAGSDFQELRIQTVRESLEGHGIEALYPDSDPFDPDWSKPFFGLYGVDAEGLCEHIADRSSYAFARELAENLAPGIQLPTQPVVVLTS